MNKVLLIGNVGNGPEIKTFDWGKVGKFSLATSESYKNKDGEKVTETEWHNIVFKGNIVDVIEKYVHKGDKIHVEGKIKTRTYEDKQGVKHWATEIIGDNIELLGGKKESETAPTAKDEYAKSGKVQTGAMSNVDELPGADDQNLPF